MRDPPVYPYIAFLLVVRPNEFTLDGRTDIQPSRIQVDVVSNSYIEAAKVASVARDRMISVFQIGWVSEQDLPPDPDTDAFRCSADYNIWTAA